MSRRVNPLFYLLIGLAAFGILSFMITDTGEFIKYVLITVGIAAILFGVFYFLMNKRNASGFSDQYKKAVKQSRRKYGSTHNQKQYMSAAKTQQKGKPDRTKKPKRNAPHLRVIEGKKDKKKNRALN
jgi:hypothetical protein